MQKKSLSTITQFGQILSHPVVLQTLHLVPAYRCKYLRLTLTKSRHTERPILGVLSPPSLLKSIVDFSVIIYENGTLKNNDQKWSIFSQLVTIFEFLDK
jgi:hypothetical protein